MSDRIYIRGFAVYTSEADLREKFRPFGKIKKLYIVKEDSPSKLFGIVRYYNPDNATKAVSEMHGKPCESSTWYVALCERKSERKIKNLTIVRDIAIQSQKKNLYLRNFPESWTEEDIKNTFAKYGQITSAKIKDNTAFVCFDKQEDAKTALDAEKTLTVDGRRVYVALWQMKAVLSRKIQKTKLKRSSSKLGRGRGSGRGRGRGRRGLRGDPGDPSEIVEIAEIVENASEAKEECLGLF
ncbi:hypothetical protein SteCoe_35514 [Stentor coeruleus]|uniref:RRM domain-containing protein n=1 Tax=Stentor coeruleus TaxID=5963 RepID=A0A1R2ASG2_9CILI|nr:hypothetical protein SteCoe_35514 [Stentor coeruleus]